jgi:ubiquinone/menaquinone biosynthesis C-methylase UbiE
MRRIAMPTTDLQTNQPAAKAAKPYKGLAMEGPIARWYTRIREHDQERGAIVHRVSGLLRSGSHVLEVAPGPGYFAIELAKSGTYHIVGLDISESFVQIARAKAREAGVAVDFRRGNASDMPFDADTFDFIFCCAAFKNFTEPVQAIREMHRVLKLGGKALIMDLRRDASLEDIKTHIKSLRLGRANALITRWTFKQFLLKNAYTSAEIRHLVAQTEFARCEIIADTIGMEIWLEK